MREFQQGPLGVHSKGLHIDAWRDSKQDMPDIQRLADNKLQQVCCVVAAPFFIRGLWRDDGLLDHGLQYLAFRVTEFRCHQRIRATVARQQTQPDSLLTQQLRVSQLTQQAGNRLLVGRMQGNAVDAGRLQSGLNSSVYALGFRWVALAAAAAAACSRWRRWRGELVHAKPWGFNQELRCRAAGTPIRRLRTIW